MGKPNRGKKRKLESEKQIQHYNNYFRIKNEHHSTNEPIETSIEFWFDGKSNEKMNDILFQPGDQHDIHIRWKENEFSVKNGASLTKINMLEVFPPGLSVHSHDGPISVYGKFNLWAKIILKNNNNHEFLLTNEEALGKITKGTFGPYPCALLTFNKEEKILDVHYLMEDGWRIASKTSFDIEKPPIGFSKSPHLNDLSQWLFDKLLWPKQILFIFSTEEDAITCLNQIFPIPYDGNTELGKVRIKVLIVEDAEKKAGLISERFIKQGIDDFPCKEIVLTDLVEGWISTSAFILDIDPDPPGEDLPNRHLLKKRKLSSEIEFDKKKKKGNDRKITDDNYNHTEPVETSIDFWFGGTKDIVFQPDETHDLSINWEKLPANSPTITAITDMELLPPGLTLPHNNYLVNSEFKPKTVSRFKLETRVSLKNTNPTEFVLVPKIILGKIKKAMFGPHPCSVMKWDQVFKTLSCKYLLNNEWKDVKIINFDVENPIKKKLDGKFWYLNPYSLQMLQALRWPKQILFIFETKDEAAKCLNAIFPKAFTKTNEISKLKIKVHILADAQNKTSLISEKLLKNGFEDFDGKEIQLLDLYPDWLTTERSKISNLEQKIVQKRKEMTEIKKEIAQLEAELEDAKKEEQGSKNGTEKMEGTEDNGNSENGKNEEMVVMDEV